jgi:Holliday junction DNA helicase RuvA
VAYLTKVSGIGRKTAEKIILELKEKVIHLSEKEDTLTQDNDALLALVALGYNRQAARDTLRSKNLIEKRESDR